LSILLRFTNNFGYVPIAMERVELFNRYLRDLLCVDRYKERTSTKLMVDVWLSIETRFSIYKSSLGDGLDPTSYINLAGKNALLARIALSISLLPSPSLFFISDVIFSFCLLKLMLCKASALSLIVDFPFILLFA